MKKIIIICLLTIATGAFLSAQNVIWSDDFEGDKGWQILESKNYSVEYTKEGRLEMESEDAGPYISSCRTNLNPIKNFSIMVEAITEKGLKEGEYFGIAVNFLDRNNYYYFCVEEGYAYFYEIRNGEKVRYEYDVVKKTKDKTFNLELKKIGTNVMFLVNDEEVLYIESIEIKSSKVGLYVAGKTKIAFDNIRIMQ